ncbi:phosphatidylethanolamine-binding protein 4 isoform X2 [Lepisosteus oculatus]|uniref:phosphatidylethanolamine-binding protein 4 isoform X2 n=1 Tax=Lepisosteus oculatus TaxID=7918 RepID=UPI00073FC53C|nr:PREDICTED: phosphatidylethanolamine-binding protein 4 isoform X2 [Lepisosteus oculatus]
MQWSGILVLCLAVSVLELDIAQGEKDRISEKLSSADEQFCRGGLEVLYPELQISECSIVPQAQRCRYKISTEWEAPQVQLTQAKKKQKYVLIMVDPDAPSRSNPTRRYWRHWLVADIVGSDLQKGDIKGTVLSEYRRPTPPSETGFHRYQLMLFEQQPKATPYLSPEEQKALGNWDLQAFIQKFNLGSPVATVQFLTQNAND